MPALEVLPLPIKPPSALVIQEPVMHFIVDKDNICLGSNIVDVSTLILGVEWVEILRGCMGDNFLCGCVMFGFSVPIRVSHCASMMSRFIVITFSVELKLPGH